MRSLLHDGMNSEAADALFALTHMGMTIDPVLQAVHLQALTKVTRRCSTMPYTAYTKHHSIELGERMIRERAAAILDAHVVKAV
jgi:hypothetical protein